MKRTPFKPKPGKVWKTLKRSPIRSKQTEKGAFRWKRLNPVSKRKREEYPIYMAKRKAFLDSNKLCQIRSKVCTSKSTCIHHGRGRIGSNYLDDSTWFASCYACNSYLETYEGKIWGKENGFRLDRLGNL